MPLNLLSTAITWLATHLVLLSLLGFLLAGLFVFGAFDAPEGRGRKTASVATTIVEVDRSPVTGAPQTLDRTPHQRSPFVPQHQAGGAPSASNEVTDAAHQPRVPDRKPPRLIGGSLPLYDQPHWAPSVGGPVPPSDGESFRPSTGPDAGVPTGATREDLFQDARRAFWNGDFEAAEAAYLSLISRYPADADAFGELGNLYQSMVKPELALDAYYEAAVRLQAAGESEKLKKVIELLKQQEDGRADQFAR